MSSTFLSTEELRELTGHTLPYQQAVLLQQRGIHYKIVRGKILVMRIHAKSKPEEELPPRQPPGLNAGLRKWQQERMRWRQENEDAIAAWQRDNARLIAEQQKSLAAERRAKELADKNAARAKRRAAQLLRTAPWANQKAIREFYREARRLTQLTGIPHHVDHEIPLQGRLVSGLHVENNLKVLPGVENCSKSNRFEP